MTDEEASSCISLTDEEASSCISFIAQNEIFYTNFKPATDCKGAKGFFFQQIP